MKIREVGTQEKKFLVNEYHVFYCNRKRNLIPHTTNTNYPNHNRAAMTKTLIQFFYVAKTLDIKKVIAFQKYNFVKRRPNLYKKTQIFSFPYIFLRLIIIHNYTFLNRYTKKFE